MQQSSRYLKAIQTGIRSLATALVSLCLLPSLPALADLEKHFTKDYALEQVAQWRKEIDSNKKISNSERYKELDFLSKLQNRLQQEVSSDMTGKNIKSDLEFIEKNNLKGSNPLFATDAKFVKESIVLVDQLEPTENPMIVLKKYMFFASVEKTKPVIDFQNSRSYINHGSSLTADPDDLDEAADAVESKIFSHPDSEEIL
jgi:hypothetical protein